MQNDLQMIESRLNAHRDVLISLVTDALLLSSGANLWRNRRAAEQITCKIRTKGWLWRLL